MIGEVWRIVPSLPAIMASSEGRIMVLPYEEAMPYGGTRQYGGQPHFGVWNKTDCRFITTYKGKTYKIAQLVCEAFNGPKPFATAVCMHMDENAANNRPDNLKWGTQKQNLNAPGYIKTISQRSRKISPRQAVAIRKQYKDGTTQSALASKFGVSHQTISDVIRHVRRSDRLEFR